MASSASFWERIGFRSAGGVGDAGWGRTLLVAGVSFIYFLPVLFIVILGPAAIRVMQMNLMN